MSANVQLGEFLRARRAEVSPESVGLACEGSYRRVAGLRREEVAQLAGVSTDYYTRLEQGRHLSPSESVLNAIAAVLGLDGAGRKHLADLAGASRARPRGRGRQHVRPGLLRLMESSTTIRRSCWVSAPMCWPRTGWRAHCSRTSTRCRRGSAT